MQRQNTKGLTLLQGKTKHTKNDLKPSITNNDEACDSVTLQTEQCSVVLNSYILINRGQEKILPHK